MKQIFKCLLILVLIARGGTLCAQLQGQPFIDSLLKELPKQKEDTNKVNIMASLSHTYVDINPDEGIRYGTMAVDLSVKLDWQKGKGDALNSLGLNYVSKSDYPKAQEYLLAAQKIFVAIDNKTGIAAITCNLGIVYSSQGDNVKALNCYQKALKMDEEIGNKKYAINVSFCIGDVYMDQSDYPQALKYFISALNAAEQIRDKSKTAHATMSIGQVYQSQGDYVKALEYLFRTLKTNEAMGDKNSIAADECIIGTIYGQQADYPTAMEYFSKSLKLYEDLGSKEGIANITMNMGIALTYQKKYYLAIEFLEQSLKADQEIGNKHGTALILNNLGVAYVELAQDTSRSKGEMAKNEMQYGDYKPVAVIPSDKVSRIRKSIDYEQRCIATCKEMDLQTTMEECYQNLKVAYGLIGDYKKALDASDNSRAIKDSIFSKENNEKIVKMGLKNEYERQRLADSLKTEEKDKITHLQLQRQKSYTYTGIAGILLLAGFSFFIVKERGKSEKERKKSEELLLNILPTEVASELKAHGTTTAKHYDNVTVLFTDFVNFTSSSERMNPQSLIDELHNCFKKFDEITGKYGIEKIKTIGDAYLAVAGLPSADAKHAEHIVQAAIEINAFMQDRVAKLGERTFQIRIGVHSGSVVAGIVGVKKFAYDIWGDTVNTAARMEQNSEAGRINISQTTYELVKDRFSCEYRGEIEAKGKGMLKMYYVV